MKKILLASLTLLAVSLNAQVTEKEDVLKVQKTDTVQGWSKGAFFNLTFGQVALSNWVGGGTNSISGNALINLHADYRKGKSLWENALNMSYGVIKQGASSSPWIKNDDRLEFNSKYGRQVKENTYGALLVNFRSQFAPGYETEAQTNLISNFAAPAYLIAAAGIDHKRKALSVFVAPATLKTTIVGNQTLADLGMYGVDAATFDAVGTKLTDGSTIRNEFGGYLRMNFNHDFTKTIGVESSADFFSNYLNNPQNIDVNWQTLVKLKVSKYLTTTIFTHLIYDDDIDIAVDTNGDGVTDKMGPRLQFKEVFGVGLSYKL